MDISANELTKWAKRNLELIGIRLNRVNNIPRVRMNPFCIVLLSSNHL